MEQVTKKQALIETWPAVLSAAMYVLIFPSASLAPLAFVFLVPVLYSLRTGRGGPRRAFWLFWTVGFLGNIGKMYWLVYTMNHYGYIPLPLALIVFGLLNATLGLYWAIPLWLVFKYEKKTKIPFLLLFPAGWIAVEWLLSWFLTGFPWDMLGNSLIDFLPMAQFADLFGVYGLSFFLVVANVAALELILYFKKSRERFPVLETALFAGLFVVILGYGLWRMPNIEAKMAQGETIKVGLLQGNVDQLVKWKPGHKKETFDNYLDLAENAAEEDVDLTIMPETSLPYWQKGDRPLSRKIRRYATDFETYTLVSYPLKMPELNADGKRKYKRHNTATLVDPEGNALGTAYKHKLVPFGEYLPFAPVVLWLKDALGLEKARLTAGFQTVDDYTALPHPKGNFGVAICYEVVFPAMVRKIANLGTDFLVTITNDAWFGNTSAPYQHVDQVAMRAIETRRSFARAANTGITCVVDPTGVVRSATEPYTRTYVVDTIQTMSIRSVYAIIGDVLVYLCLALIAAAILQSKLAARKK
jgi:apolipoprotein N-acyltransferase